MKKIIVFFLVISSSEAFSQSEDAFACKCPMMTDGTYGKFYFAFGYNLDWFTRSDIHFKDKSTGNYDFVIRSVKAEDNPGLRRIFNEDISIPQYSYRLGYWFGDKGQYSLEINYDHVKYIMIDGQFLHLTGEINGVYYDTDTLVTPGFIAYEHTNGANYMMVNTAYRKNFLSSKNQKHWLSFVGRAGAGIVLPRSDTRMMGNRRNDTYHIAGYVTGIDIGLRYDFLKNFFLETSGKGCFANYTNVYLYGDGRANQHWFSFEFIFTAGYQFKAKLF